MVALVLAAACLEKFGGDSVAETARNHAAYLASIPTTMRSEGTEGTERTEP
jgi:chorismate synthase